MLRQVVKGISVRVWKIMNHSPSGAELFEAWQKHTRVTRLAPEASEWLIGERLKKSV